MIQVTLMKGSGRFFSGWAAASSTNIHRGSCFSTGKAKRSIQKEKEILGCAEEADAEPYGGSICVIRLSDENYASTCSIYMYIYIYIYIYIIYIYIYIYICICINIY